MLLDYDFLLLLNDESGNPTRYYYLLQDFEKDFVASKVAQNGAKRFVKEIIGKEKASKTKNSAIEVSNTKASAIKNETIGSGDLKKVCEKIKSGLPFGIISAFKPFKDAFYRECDDPTKEFKNVLAAGVMIRVVFNQAFFIRSFLIAFDHPINRAFAINDIVKGFFGDLSDGDILVINDAIPFFGHFIHIIIALYFGVL